MAGVRNTAGMCGTTSHARLQQRLQDDRETLHTTRASPNLHKQLTSQKQTVVSFIRTRNHEASLTV